MRYKKETLKDLVYSLLSKEMGISVNDLAKKVKSNKWSVGTVLRKLYSEKKAITKGKGEAQNPLGCITPFVKRPSLWVKWS